MKDIDVETVIAALEAAARNENAGAKDWTKESLANLTKHVVATHHAYCKEELPRLSGLAAKVANVHGGTNPELGIVPPCTLATFAARPDSRGSSSLQ